MTQLLDGLIQTPQMGDRLRWKKGKYIYRVLPAGWEGKQQTRAQTGTKRMHATAAARGLLLFPVSVRRLMNLSLIRP
jgi:hypothetical protein